MVKQYLIVLAVLLSIFALAWLAQPRLPWFHSSAYENIYEANALPLFDEASLTQTFRAKYPGLSRVEIFFRNPGSNPGRVMVSLRSTCSSPDSLASFEVPESQLLPNQYYPFDFPLLDDSAGKEYCLLLTTAGITSPNELLVHTSRSDIYAGGEAQYDAPAENASASVSTPLPGKYTIWLPLIQQGDSIRHKSVDIAFQLYYTGPLPLTLGALLEQLTVYKTFLFGQRWFYPVIAGLYVVALVGLLVIVWSRQVRADL